MIRREDLRFDERAKWLDEPACCATSPDGWVCTLAPGHAGDHHAVGYASPWRRAEDAVRDGRHLGWIAFPTKDRAIKMDARRDAKRERDAAEARRLTGSE